MSQQNIGTVAAINGPVLDIKFTEGELPNLMNAIEIANGDGKVVAEVAQHLGDDTVRCIAMSSTDGMVRGMPAVDTGAPISVPVVPRLWAEFSMYWGNPWTTAPR